MGAVVVATVTLGVVPVITLTGEVEVVATVVLPPAAVAGGNTVAPPAEVGVAVNALVPPPAMPTGVGNAPAFTPKLPPAIGGSGATCATSGGARSTTARPNAIRLNIVHLCRNVPALGTERRKNRARNDPPADG